MPEFFVNTRRTQDCTFLVEADTAEEARTKWEANNGAGYDRDILESREDIDSIELHTGGA